MIYVYQLLADESEDLEETADDMLVIATVVPCITVAITIVGIVLVVILCKKQSTKKIYVQCTINPHHYVATCMYYAIDCT